MAEQEGFEEMVYIQGDAFSIYERLISTRVQTRQT